MSAVDRSKLSTNPQDPERLRDLTQLVGLRLRHDTEEISSGMTVAIERAIGELDDQEMRASLHASVTNNVEVIVDLLAHTKEASDLPPLPHAHRYAEELAREDVPEAALRRAYHVGSNHLLAHVFDQVQEVDCESHEKLQLYHHLAGWTYRYVDEITRAVIATYQDERRFSDERAARTINSYVNRILTGEEITPHEFEAATGYDLGQVHLGCRVWIEESPDSVVHASALSRLIDHIATRLDADRGPLVVETGRGEADVWFGRGRDGSAVDADSISSIARDTVGARDAVGARVAFGAPGEGASGFRRSRAQAHQAARIVHVATAAESSVISYSQEGVPVIARLTDDLGATRSWVREVLGGLAEQSERAERQRETVRVFLESASSYSETAARLLLHRNTVRYRLDRAEAELGRGVADTPLDTQLALALCRLLGSVVLTPERPSSARTE